MGWIRYNAGFITLCIGLLLPFSAFAQSYPTYDQFLPVATINQDRLFSTSQFGQSFNQKFQSDANVLAEENRRIEKELAIEESDLTQKRKELENVEFRKLASVFNEKVEAIRRDQSQKLNDLNASRIQAQRAFFLQAKPIIIDLMEERGIQYILNDQAIFMSGNSGDITDTAVQRIDQILGSALPTEQQ
jgi:Skp family chaperone for outer membrane proteins